MAIDIVVPRLGWDMEEGTFGGWLKRDGEVVKGGELLFTLESDKATEDIECLDNGILHIPASGPKAGDKVTVGTVIGYLMAPGEPPPSEGQAEARRREDKETRKQADREKDRLSLSPLPVSSAPSILASPTISPRAKRIATELGIDWLHLHGSGRTGRIRERDVRAAAQKTAEAPGTQVTQPAISSIRKKIAERMLQSLRSTAPVTLTTTADATNLVNLREQFKASPTREHVPSFTDFAVKLVAIALGDHPVLNARRDGDRIIVSESIHIGIAVDTEAGLLVPVLHDVPRHSLRQLASHSRDLVERARQGKLRLAEMQGGTFTVTNLGAFGVDAFTPIINSPECAILGIGRIQRQAVVAEKQIIDRDMVTLSLTFDHCIVDGAPAARFLQAVAKLIENPSPWLIS
jgi:pyruvate dehydrogenase E2 component (dihydrolipoamide acetyltransferase)